MASDSNSALYVAAALIFVSALFFWSRRRRGPKCTVPWGDLGEETHWLFGALRIKLDDFSRQAAKGSAKFGPIFRVRLVPFLSSTIVFVNDVDLFKEISGRKDFASRDPVSDAGNVLINPDKKGIILQDWSASWKNLHKFSISVLNSFGFGKQSMESKVLEEADLLIDAMLEEKEAFVPVDLIRVAVSNVISKLVFSERSDIHATSKLHSAIYDAGEGFFNTSTHPLYMLYPKLVLLYKTASLRRISAAWSYVKSHVAASVMSHEATINVDEPRDFIDAFVAERRRRPDAEHLTHANMLQTVADLFQAGTDTTTSTLGWTMLWLLNKPRVLEKLREELTRELGEDGVPSIAILPQLNYLRAFMDEVQRKSSIAEFSVPHRCVDEAAEFHGYTITRKESIWLNILAVHSDPRLWDDVHEFKPERFLDAEGKYVKNNNLITFGYGLRRCVGERLALLEQFIFTTRLVQRLDFRLDDAHPPPDLIGFVKLAREPSRYYIRVKARD